MNEVNKDISIVQKEILDFIKKQIIVSGYPPSMREICSATGLKSTSSVYTHLSKLEQKGYIRRDSSKTRAIEVIDNDKEFNYDKAGIVNVPIVGTVAAGIPILATQNIEGYFPISESITTGRKLFMLKVKGSSMINAGIYDKDYVLVESQPTAQRGEIVVALVDDSATVKRFFPEHDHIRLQPENDTMTPIIVNDCKILGKVKGVFRIFS